MLHASSPFDKAVKPEESSFLTLSPLDTYHSQSNSDSEDLGGTRSLHFYQVFLAFPISPFQVIQNSPV